MPHLTNFVESGQLLKMSANQLYAYNGDGASVQQVPVENVVVTGRLENGLEYVSSKVRDDAGERPVTTTVNTVGDTTLVTWELGTLPNDRDVALNYVSIDLRTRVPAGAAVGDVLTATASVTTTTQPEPDLTDNVDQDVLTVAPPSADLRVNKWGCGQPRPGGWCLYELDVYNEGTVPITDAVLIDYLPAGLTVLGGGEYDAVSPVVGDAAFGPGTLSFAQQVVTWTLPPLAPGYSVGVELLVEVSDALTVGHVLTNTAYVTRTIVLSDANPADNEAALARRVVTGADVLVSKYPYSPYWYDSSLMQPGELLTYRAYAWNYSHLIAENTVVTDVVLTNASLVTATADEGIVPTVVGDAAVWNLGDFVGYPYFDVYVTAQIAPDLSPGQSFANLLWASTTSPDPLADNYDLEYDTIGIPPQESILGISKYSYGCRVPGGVVEFNVLLYNQSGVTATNVVVTDTLPDGLTYGGSMWHDPSTVAGQDVIWNLGDVPPSTSEYLAFTATVDSGLAPGTVLTNTVRITSDNEDIGELSNNVQHYCFRLSDIPYADLGVYKEIYEQTIQIGSSYEDYVPLVRRGRAFDYQIEVRNGSGCPAENVVLRDVLPDGMTFVSASLTPTVRSGQVITWELGTLEQGTEKGRTITVTVRPEAGVAAGTFLWNRAYVTSTTYDPYPDDNTAVFITGINESALVYLPLVLRNY